MQLSLFSLDLIPWQPPSWWDWWNWGPLDHTVMGEQDVLALFNVALVVVSG